MTKKRKKTEDREVRSAGTDSHLLCVKATACSFILTLIRKAFIFCECSIMFNDSHNVHMLQTPEHNQSRIIWSRIEQLVVLST